MRVRIIFRGLTLFTFEKEADPGDPTHNRGTLTAYLVSHGTGPHVHRPKLQIFGRDTTPDGPQHTVLAEDLQGKTVAMKLEGHAETEDGVKVLPSFLDYVPDLRLLNTEKRPGFSPGATGSIKSEYVAAKVVIENGEIRSRDFVSWDWHGNGPVPVAYMGTRFRGFAASEVVVDAGDDSDGNAGSGAKYLRMTFNDSQSDYKCFPLVGKSGGSDDVSPNTVEVSITNFAHQRPRPLYWNLHYQWLFAAAGFKSRLDSANAPLYAGSDQYVALAKAAKAFDQNEWNHDSMVKTSHILGQPFPFILDRLEPLAPIAEFREPYVPTGHPPFPPGTGHDPNSRPICPFGHV